MFHPQCSMLLNWKLTNNVMRHINNRLDMSTCVFHLYYPVLFLWKYLSFLFTLPTALGYSLEYGSVWSSQGLYMIMHAFSYMHHVMSEFVIYSIVVSNLILTKPQVPSRQCRRSVSVDIESMCVLQSVWNSNVKINHTCGYY